MARTTTSSSSRGSSGSGSGSRSGSSKPKTAKSAALTPTKGSAQPKEKAKDSMRVVYVVNEDLHGRPQFIRAFSKKREAMAAGKGSLVYNGGEPFKVAGAVAGKSVFLMCSFDKTLNKEEGCINEVYGVFKTRAALELARTKRNYAHVTKASWAEVMLYEKMADIEDLDGGSDDDDEDD